MSEYIFSNEITREQLYIIYLYSYSILYYIFILINLHLF